MLVLVFISNRRKKFRVLNVKFRRFLNVTFFIFIIIFLLYIFLKFQNFKNPEKNLSRMYFFLVFYRKNQIRFLVEKTYLSWYISGFEYRYRFWYFYWNRTFCKKSPNADQFQCYRPLLRLVFKFHSRYECCPFSRCFSSRWTSTTFKCKTFKDNEKITQNFFQRFVFFILKNEKKISLVNIWQNEMLTKNYFK